MACSPLRENDHRQRAHLENYLYVYRASGNKSYLTVAEEIIDWYRPDMTDAEHGGFYAHQDADISPENDGDYFARTRSDIEEVLPPDPAELITLYFSISDAPYDLHGNTDWSIMYTVPGLEKVAGEIGLWYRGSSDHAR